MEYEMHTCWHVDALTQLHDLRIVDVQVMAVALTAFIVTAE